MLEVNLLHNQIFHQKNSLLFNASNKHISSGTLLPDNFFDLKKGDLTLSLLTIF